MIKTAMILFLSITALNSYSQNKNNWIMFEDKKTELKGYKDLRGNIKIKPKFVSLTNALIFENIIPVYEKIDKGNKNDYKTYEYYLLKNEKKIGKDSLYMWDFTLDCENENKIRFRDRKTDKVGFFNKNGKIVIPAVYNDASPFYNGFCLAIKDAKRICWEGNEFSKENPCEHWSWKGNNVLINEKNKILIENIDLNKVSFIDWYSLKVNQENLDSTFVTFKSKNGNTYSFIDLKKEFEKWLYNDFMKSKNSSVLLDNMFDEITISKNPNWKSKEFENTKYKDFAWVKERKEYFYSNNKNHILEILNKLNVEELNIDISSGTGPILLNFQENKKYFSNCGEYLNIKYPYFEIYITKKDGSVLNTLGFIKTENGYKLLEIS